MRPLLLDLFCKAGGAAMGYHRAGFDVLGVDLEPQPNYPFEFVLGDALAFDIPAEAVAVHASPPCQMWSGYRPCRPERGDDEFVNLIPETRDKLAAWGGPYVIENVPGAPLVDPVLICGSMFDPPLDVQRHRLFESNWGLTPPAWPCRHKLWAPRFDRGSRSTRPNDRRTVAVGEWRIPLEVQQRAMGIDWMTVAELMQAIPPAYTQHIGERLMVSLGIPAPEALEAAG